MTSATAGRGPATLSETPGSQAEKLGPESTVSAARLAAQRLLRMGEPLLAYNELQQALELKPADFRLRQLQGLALIRSGALRRANEVLAALREDGCTDAETMGPLARTHKDLALAAQDREDRQRHLLAAHEIYEAAYRDAVARDAVSEAYYTGINAATMALLRRHVQHARRIAAEVEQLCRRALGENPGGAREYWPRATLAEAALILGELDVAKKRYRKATALAGTNYGDLSSTRHQARILLDHLGIEPSWLDNAIKIPPVLVFTGHMIDAPGRDEPRFPLHMAEEVRRRIRSKIEKLRPAAAYGSAACGADILCLEVVRELGGELHIVLPFPAEQFLSESVEFCKQGDWGERFRRLLEDASEVLVISEKPPPCCASTFEYANLVMTGLARLRSQVLDTKLHGIAIWDGSIAGDVGGTSSVVDLWQQYGVATEQVDPRPDTERSPTSQVPKRLAGNPGDDIAVHEPRFQYAIRAMLFADAVGYSRLSEGQIPLFFEHYLGAIASYNGISRYAPEHIETAGDGMYMVFEDPHAAGHYALDLSELIAGRDWPAFGLPADLSMRVGLHCGPVYIGRDPITGSPLYTGIHASRTARIEPITPPGQVYASGAFAAVAAARHMEGLRFSYIGRTQLAKQYGALALYHVKRP